MTGLEGNEKRVRRLELDVKTGTLRWHVPKFLFIGVDEKVALKEARVSGTSQGNTPPHVPQLVTVVAEPFVGCSTWRS